MERSDLVWSPLTPLTKIEIDKLAPAEGAFRVSEKRSDDKYYVIFVGSSDNIKAELLKIISDTYTHSSFKNYLASGKSFAFKYVGGIKNEEERRAIEKQMYKNYAPRFNDQEPLSSIESKVNLN